jgi:cupin 2 domain-containing protein
MNNIFQNILDSDEELFEEIFSNEVIKFERIVSSGQSTPKGEWYDQEWNEFVILLSGSAEILFEGDTTTTTMQAGDYINIPAHRKHRVETTSTTEKSIWLAVHYK